MTEKTDAYGQWIESESVFIFFGNQDSFKYTDSKNIQFGNQVHKADLVKIDNSLNNSTNLLEDSDGLWTNKPNLKLGIYTADCVPCFIYNDHQLFSLHLGWRSLHQGLLEKALSRMSNQSETQLYIGPHIQAASFEVGDEVFKEFKKQIPDSSDLNWSVELPNKKYKLSLEKMIRYKSKDWSPQVFSSKVDTFTSNSHCSYRRQNQTKMRNISFAFLK